MSLTCIISEASNLDLERIADYLGSNYGLANSERFIDGITSRLKHLAQFPRIGRSREEMAKGLRSLPYEKYLILYKVDERSIKVVRVVSGYQDLSMLFNDA